MAVSFSPTFSKYKCVWIAVCFLALLIYYKYTNYLVDNADMDAEKADLDVGKPVLDTENSNLVAENESVVQATASLHRRVDPKSLNREQIEQILRDSIEMFNLKNLIKPANEECVKRPPSVIVIGVPKSGTRELMDFVHLHPHIQIYHRQIYEMNFFVEQENDEISSLTKQMPCSFSNQLTMMKNAWYFHTNNVDVPERIHKFNASIRLILMVREPIARAYSHYSFFKDMPGQGYNETFDEMAINAVSKKNQEVYDVFSMSMYDKDMERWLKVFNRSQIHIIEHSEFQKDPVSVLKRVEEFLGLGHYITSDMFAYNAETGFQCIRSNLTTTGMSCYASNRGRHHKPISSEIKAKLKIFFKPKNQRFFKIIGKSFNNW